MSLSVVALLAVLAAALAGGAVARRLGYPSILGELMAGIVAQLRAAAPEAPILVHANAGMPQTVDGKTVFPESASRA